MPVTKSGLSEETSRHIRSVADFLLSAHTNERGEIDKNAIQAAVLRELFTDEDQLVVADAIGAVKGHWLFEGMRFTIYEMLRHKIRNKKQLVETTRGLAIQTQIREIQQVFAGPTSRIAKLTLRMTPIETQLVIDEYDKRIKRMQWERRKFLSGLRKMRAEPAKYPNLGLAWGVKPAVVQKKTRKGRSAAAHRTS